MVLLQNSVELLKQGREGNMSLSGLLVEQLNASPGKADDLLD